MPHVSVCCKSLASQVLLKEPKGIEITGPHAASWTWKWLRHCGCEVMDRAPCSPELAFHDCLLCGPTKKHVNSKKFATDTYLQQAVTSYPQTLDTDCSTPGHKTCCYGETNAEMPMVTTWKSDVYYLLPMCYIYVEVRIKILTSECRLPYS